MKIGVWRTNHEIADTVGIVVYDALHGDRCLQVAGQIYDTPRVDGVRKPTKMLDFGDVDIGYGILRGMDNVFRECDKRGKPWLNIDRGYWKPGHYDGYYRISLRGTQQTTGLAQLEPDYERWDRLGIEVLPARKIDKSLPILICPPTDYVSQFYGLSEFPNTYESEWFGKPKGQRFIMRPKGCERPLQEDLDNCSKVCTFNSSVAWEALRQGIPVVSDPKHSFVGAYQKQVDALNTMDIKSRLRMFAVQASLQLTILEIRSGKLWPLLQRLLELRTNP